MKIKRINQEFSVCQVEDYSLVKMGWEDCVIEKAEVERW